MLSFFEDWLSQQLIVFNPGHCLPILSVTVVDFLISLTCDWSHFMSLLDSGKMMSRLISDADGSNPRTNAAV